MRKQFYQTALGNCYDLKLQKCWLQFKKKKYCVIRYNFRHTFVPYLYRAVIFKLNNIEQKSKVIWRRDASPLNRLIVRVSNCKGSLFGDAWESVTTCVRACIWNADGLRNRESAKNGHWTVCCTQVSDVKHKIFGKCQASVNSPNTVV